MSKKAVLIGINYKNTSSELRGCINDVNNVKSLLISQYKLKESDIIMLTDDTLNNLPTYDNIIKIIDWMVSESNKSKCDLYFHYSGHGTQIIDENNEEIDGLDEGLVPLDYEKKGIITDDIINDRLIKRLSKNTKMTIVMDCCHSGSICDLKYGVKIVNNQDIITKITDNKSNAKVIMLSGCRDEQTSADAYINSKNQGALTWSMLEVLKDSNYRLRIHNFIRRVRNKLQENNYSQIPEISFSSYPNLNENFSLF